MKLQKNLPTKVKHEITEEPPNKGQVEVRVMHSLASHTLCMRRKGLVPYGRCFCSVGMQLLLLWVELKSGAQREM